MSENFHSLCCLLVEEFYGLFHKRLFSQLTYHGRLSAWQISRLCHIPLRKVKAGLSVLVQYQLAYHHTTLEGSTTYQARTDTAYNLLRVGRLIDLARNKLGDLAAAILSESVLLGFATVAELGVRATDVLSQLDSRFSVDTHGTGNNVADLDSAVTLAIEKLLEHGYLSQVRSTHFQSEFDARQDVEKLLRLPQTGQVQIGKKATQEIEEQVENTLRKRLSPRTSETGYIPDARSDKKRALDESGDRNLSKKQKLNGGMTAVVNGSGSSSKPFAYSSQATVVSVNFKALITSTRNRNLQRRANKILGTKCGEVLVEAMSQVPSTEPWSLHPAFSILDIGSIRDGINRRSQHVAPSNRLQNGLTKLNGSHPHIEDEVPDARISYGEIDRHLALLSEGEFRFLQGSPGEEWHISKHEMDNFIRHGEILRMMNDRLPSPALRMIRMLIDKGKLDEKTLQELGLLGAKELRQMLAQLKQMGYIDLQEVPRESQRQPNRTIFLWFHDADRVQKVLLESTYKAMTRLVQRMSTEKNKVSSTLEKIERSDVQGNEEQIMSPAELRVLKRWQRLEEWLLGELARLDDSVVLLRDL